MKNRKVRLGTITCLAYMAAVCLWAGYALYGHAAGQPPNVLFCIADDASPHCGAYGCAWVQTPHIDRVAREGLLFRHAYTPTAKCAPARAAILTGRNPWQLEEAGNHQSYFPARYKAFTEVLREAGVHVGALGKTWGPGEATTADGQPRDFGLTRVPGSGAMENPGAGFREFLAARPKDKPFFFWFGSSHPHRPYTADAGTAAGKKPTDIDRVPSFWPDSDVVRRDLLDYATEIEAFDAQVGSLLRVLDESGEADDTLVIVTSDHGLPFPRVKGHTYQMAHHVPLVARWPKGIARPGREVSDLVTFVALAPTFLELHGLRGENQGMARLTGASLLDLLRGEPEHERPFIVLGRERHDVWARPGTEAGLGYPSRGIRSGRWLFIHNFAPDRWPCGNPELGLLDTDASPTKALISKSGEADRYWQLCFGKRPAEELFDVEQDPDCVHNLADDAGHQTLKRELRDTLFAELRAQQDPRMFGEGDKFDRYPTAKRRPQPNDPAASPKAKKNKKNANPAAN